MSKDMKDSVLVRINGVHNSKDGAEILKDIDLEIERGKVVCLLGPSGAGKSTLLRCINAIERFDSGVIYVDGEPIGFQEENGALVRLRERDVARQRAEIGMVFQNFNLFPHLSVLENIINAPIRVKGIGRERAVEIAQDLLKKIGLSEKINYYPRQLSGGQQQRIAIARALAMTPKLMLFDEPTSALDPHITGEVLDVLRTLASSGMTMVVVTHEISFAQEVADDVVIMSEGRIIEKGPVDRVLLNPSNPITKMFLSKSVRAAA